MGSEDELFCQIAIRLGLIDEVQAAAALEVQAELDPPQPIGKILVAAGYLTPSGVEQILAAQARERGTVSEPEARKLLRVAGEDRALGKLAVLRGLTTEGEVEECVFVQRQLADKGEVVPLGELLVLKGYVRDADLAGLLKLQRAAARTARRLSDGVRPEET